MDLYERDYRVIRTEEETRAQVKYMEYEAKTGFKNTGDDPRHSDSNNEIRKFLWCYNSLFPNNYLYHLEPASLDLEFESEDFKRIVNEAKNENEIQSYIKDNRKWFIPASIYKEYSFGHHAAYLFPELQLGNKYVVDYALLGKNSDGYSIVFVELEKANVPYMLSTSNTEHESARKGLTQIKDWKRWLDEHRDYFLKSSDFSKNGISIPTTRIYYCLVVSKRDLMNECSAELRSQTCYEMINTKIISYDRLVDNIKKLNNGY